MDLSLQPTLWQENFGITFFYILLPSTGTFLWCRNPYLVWKHVSNAFFRIIKAIIDKISLQFNAYIRNQHFAFLTFFVLTKTSKPHPMFNEVWFLTQWQNQRSALHHRCVWTDLECCFHWILNSVFFAANGVILHRSQHEFGPSARAVLRLHVHDHSCALCGHLLAVHFDSGLLLDRSMHHWGVAHLGKTTTAHVRFWRWCDVLNFVFWYLFLNTTLLSGYLACDFLNSDLHERQSEK